VYEREEACEFCMHLPALLGVANEVVKRKVRFTLRNVRGLSDSGKRNYMGMKGGKYFDRPWNDSRKNYGKREVTR